MWETAFPAVQAYLARAVFVDVLGFRGFCSPEIMRLEREKTRKMPPSARNARKFAISKTSGVGKGEGEVKGMGTFFSSNV